MAREKTRKQQDDQPGLQSLPNRTIRSNPDHQTSRDILIRECLRASNKFPGEQKICVIRFNEQRCAENTGFPDQRDYSRRANEPGRLHLEVPGKTE
jgi:hypothetical protein